MTQPETAVRRFFQDYAQNSSEGNMTSLLSQFADPFLSADPHRTQCVRIDDLAAALPKRKLLFDRLGCKPARLINLEETLLDVGYVLAKTSWRLDFVHADLEETEQILADSTFLVDIGREDFKIIMYIAHQDIMHVLRERGILSE